MSRRIWTFPELYDAARAVESGRTWPEVAAQFKCNESTLRALLRTHDCYPDLSKRPKREHPRADLVLQALRIRNVEHLSWSLIAERVGWPHKSQALQKACARHVSRHGGSVRQGMPDVRRSRWG